MGMREWLKENVKEEEYVVMKAEVDVLEVMMRRRNMETDVRGYVYAFFSLHYLLFCCPNCFNHLMLILFCCGVAVSGF